MAAKIGRFSGGDSVDQLIECHEKFIHVLFLSCHACVQIVDVPVDTVVIGPVFLN